MLHLGRCMRHLHSSLVAAVLAAASVVPAWAQSANGSIEGLIVDQSAAVLPGVAVTIRQPAIGLERAIVTSANGEFSAPLLPVGVYELTATLAGFTTWKQTGVRLTVGQTLTFRIEMWVAGVAETVSVSGDTSSIETRRSHVSSTIDEVAVQSLPVNGRNFIDFVLLTPGVTRDVRGGDISFAGQRGTLNSLVVDGADNNNTFAGQTLGRTGSGRAPYQFSQDAVKEFQVNSNSFSAEYGRAGGALIHVVTKSGTNAFHGSLFEFYRDKALNANDPINVLNHRPKSPYHYHQFGGTLGGPLRANRDFFFLNYDGQRNTQPNDVFLNLPSVVPDDEATRIGIEMLRPLAFNWTRRLDQDVLLIKADHQLNTGHRLSMRYNHQNFTGGGFEAGGPQSAFEHSGDSFVNTRTLTASWAGLFRSIHNELRFQYARDNEPGTANSADPEAVIRQGGSLVLAIGRNNFSPRANTIDRLQFADALTWARGPHNLKAGFDFQFDRIDNYFPGFFNGSYAFQSLASFALRRPESYQQNFPVPGTSGATTAPDSQEYSVFVQDELKGTRDLTLNLGLRYDLMKTDAAGARNPDADLAAAGIDTSRLRRDTNNWGPRLGVAWSPHGRPYVVRAGSGLFYGRTPAVMVTAAQSNNGVNVLSLRFSRDQGIPPYPQTFTEIPAGARATPTILYMDEDFANPRLWHANVAFEWELLRRTTLTVTYLFVDGADLPRAVDRNLGSPASTPYTIDGSTETVMHPVFRSDDRPFRSFQRVIAFESSAESRYQGLTIELNRRLAGAVQFRAAYTLGKVVDTVPDATAVLPGNAGDDAKYASNPLDFDTDRTFGNNDQRHRFVASGIVTSDPLADRLAGRARVLVRGWSVAAIVTAQSGQPFSARVRGDLNGDGNENNDLAPGTRRNALRLPAIVTFDPRIVRDIPLAGRSRAQIIWEAFNVFNRDNINQVATTYYTRAGGTLRPNAEFGRPRGTAGERIMQVALRLAF